MNLYASCVAGCAWTLCCILTGAGETTVPVRQLAGVILRQMVIAQWEQLAQEERAHVKGGLLPVLCNAEAAPTSQLTHHPEKD